MVKLKNKIAFIIATKDRPVELRRLLKSMEAQTYRPDQIIIVDGSDKPIKEIVSRFKKIKITYLRCIPPSASRQRNYGLKAVKKEINLIGFVDDDVVLYDNSLKNMMLYWENAASDVVGVGFNIVNCPKHRAKLLKKHPLTLKLGLYPKEVGMVSPSGFHTLRYVKKDILVRWLPTTSVWRKKVFTNFRFDEWYSDYGYLEDLDFSYQVGKIYRLLILADAKCYHNPAPEGRGDGYFFGKKEVINRIYFVKKDPELSLFKCYITLTIRLLMTLGLFVKSKNIGYLQRAMGNFTAMFYTLFNNLQ